MAWPMVEQQKNQPGGFAGRTKRPNTGTLAKEMLKQQQAQHRKALELINKGNLKEGERIYRQLIEEGTENYQVYGNLATLCGMAQRYDELVKYLIKAIELKPDYIEAYNNLGVGLKQIGNVDGAIEAYKKALQLNAKQPKTYFNLANAERERGNASAAAAAYREAIHLDPDYPEAYNNLGNTLREQGAEEEAICAYKKAVSIKSNYIEAINNLGNALKEKGEIGEALACFRKATQLAPDNPEAWFNLGVAHKDRNDPTAAVEAYKKALQLKPQYPEALNNIGCCLKAVGRVEDACRAYRKALEIKPDYAEAANNLGIALKEQGKLESATSAYLKAIELKRDYAEAYNNLGVALKELGGIGKAIKTYEKALELKPDYDEAHWNLALTLLLQGDFERGWEQYEWRNAKGKALATTHAIPRCARSKGAPFATKVPLLLVTEQGLGDTLLFMRYVKALQRMGIQVSLCAQAKLHGLIQESGIDSEPIDPIKGGEVEMGEWMPLLSVPRHLKVSRNNPVWNEPYIKSSETLINKWKAILSKERGPIIGINWQGNPETERTGLRGRSLPLEEFAQISVLNEVSLVSLQKGYGCEQLDSCSFQQHFVSSQDQVSATWDFLETAAIIANCDLVITSDTSVAHLAGGMGKTTWLLLHKVPDWRWGLEGHTTFWYPSMRLYRQEKPGDWTGVLQRVSQDLQRYCAEYGDKIGGERPR